MKSDIRILNKKAKFEYIILDRYTAGIQLFGTEIKSIREGKASLAAASAAEKTQESQAFQEKRRAEMQAKPRSSVHKVRSGESLSTIAKKYHTTVSKLCRLNGITEKTILRPGQILKYS